MTTYLVCDGINKQRLVAILGFSLLLPRRPTCTPHLLQTLLLLACLTCTCLGSLPPKLPLCSPCSPCFLARHLPLRRTCCLRCRCCLSSRCRCCPVVRDIRPITELHQNASHLRQDADQLLVGVV